MTIAIMNVRKASSGVASTMFIFGPAVAVAPRGRALVCAGEPGVALDSCPQQRGATPKPSNTTIIVRKAHRMFASTFRWRIRSTSSAFAARFADRPALRADQLAPLFDERALSADRTGRPVGRALVGLFFCVFRVWIDAGIHQHSLTSWDHREKIGDTTTTGQFDIRYR